MPALSIPAPALVDGLPVGVQLVGRPWADEWLLELAGTLEAAGAAGVEEAPDPRTLPEPEHAAAEAAL